MNKQYRWGAVLATAALVFAACGDAPEETSDTASESAAPAESEAPSSEAMTEESTEAMTEGSSEAMTEGSSEGGDATASVEGAACMITDTGGVDDRSFNQTSYEGMTQAETDFGVEAKLLESGSETDFGPNINTFLGDDCALIVTVGFLLGDATATAAQENPDQNFAIVDVDYFDAEAGEDITYDNVRELTFATDQAAFLAGYLAAGMTETGTVGTYGGIPIPSVTIFMDGFLAGVLHHNAEKGTDVNVLGWDGNPDSGTFTGNFESQDDGRNVTDQMLAEGADIIMPVAGPVGLGSAAALRESSGDDMLVWVDTDGYESAAEYGDLMLTSVQKKMDTAVYDTIGTVAEGAFEGGLYTGTLENDGVGIAPFHDFEGEVPEELVSELDTLREGIIAGDISVSPADYQG